MITLLGLSDIEITEVTLTNDYTLKIYVKSIKEGCHCHQCGKYIEHYYGMGQEIKLRHLPVFGYKTYIILTPKRYQCSTAIKTLKQPKHWIGIYLKLNIPKHLTIIFYSH